mgnify:CR=1 FL=1
MPNNILSLLFYFGLILKWQPFGVKFNLLHGLLCHWSVHTDRRTWITKSRQYETDRNVAFMWNDFFSNCFRCIYILFHASCWVDDKYEGNLDNKNTQCAIRSQSMAYKVLDWDLLAEMIRGNYHIHLQSLGNKFITEPYVWKIPRCPITRVLSSCCSWKILVFLHKKDKTFINSLFYFS